MSANDRPCEGCDGVDYSDGMIRGVGFCANTPCRCVCHAEAAPSPPPTAVSPRFVVAVDEGVCSTCNGERFLPRKGAIPCPDCAPTAVTPGQRAEWRRLADRRRTLPRGSFDIDDDVDISAMAQDAVPALLDALDAAEKRLHRARSEAVNWEALAGKWETRAHRRQEEAEAAESERDCQRTMAEGARGEIEILVDRLGAAEDRFGATLGIERVALAARLDAAERKTSDVLVVSTVRKKLYEAAAKRDGAKNLSAWLLALADAAV